jgi:excisionase family DNA binding protein
MKHDGGSARIVDTPTLAELLGCNRKTVYDLVRSGAIPAMRLGADYRYDLDRVLAALHERAQTQNAKGAPRNNARRRSAHGSHGRATATRERAP